MVAPRKKFSSFFPRPVPNPKKMGQNGPKSVKKRILDISLHRKGGLLHFIYTFPNIFGVSNRFRWFPGSNWTLSVPLGVPDPGPAPEGLAEKKFEKNSEKSKKIVIKNIFFDVPKRCGVLFPSKQISVHPHPPLHGPHVPGPSVPANCWIKIPDLLARFPDVLLKVATSILASNELGVAFSGSLGLTEASSRYFLHPESVTTKRSI